VPEEVKIIMLKVTAEAKETFMKKRRLNIIVEDIQTEGVETNSTQSGIHGMLAYKGSSSKFKSIVQKR